VVCVDWKNVGTTEVRQVWAKLEMRNGFGTVTDTDAHACLYAARPGVPHEKWTVS